MLDTVRIGQLLTAAASALDISDAVYEEATAHYEDVANWLGAEDSALLKFEPDLYVQGSFRLGTVIRPVNEADEYDIDLVCRLSIEKERVTQDELKTLIGNRLKARSDLARMLSPSRRCWILNYGAGAGGAAFHMDVLPSIPNVERPPSGLLLTDKELRLWQKSNPRAYAEWFYGRMRIVLQEQRAALAKSIGATIEEVPDWKVKTPLQVVVQLLKRHRDIHFNTAPDLRPVSIIITTLAAEAYSNQPDVFAALLAIVGALGGKQSKVGSVENRNGKWWIANPVDPDENFADKWNEYPERRKAFEAWVDKLTNDFKTVAGRSTLNEAAADLAKSLGRAPLTKAFNLVEARLPLSRAVIPYSNRVPAIGDTSHVQQLAIPQRATYTAAVGATVHWKKGWPKLFELSDRPVAKNRWLRFTVSTDAGGPYAVRWQVVNTGGEAVRANSLRGDFYNSDGDGPNVRWESTSYRGTHWVEAFIVKNGVCVARSGRTLVRVE